MLGNKDCADLPVNMPEQGSEEWVKPHIGNKTSTHFIEEIEDEEEWKNSSINSFSNTFYSPTDSTGIRWNPQELTGILEFQRIPAELTRILEFWRIPVEWTGIHRN